MATTKKYTTESLQRAFTHHVSRGALYSVNHLPHNIPRPWRVTFALGIIDLTNREAYAMVIGLAASQQTPYKKENAS